MSRCEIRWMTYSAGLSLWFISSNPRTQCSTTGTSPLKIRLFWVFDPHCKDFSDPMLTIKVTRFKPNPARTYLLEHNLLLLRIDAALCILRCYRDDCFSGSQRRCEVMKAAIGANNGHFVAIHHHPGADFRFPGQLDYVPMLNKRIERQRNGSRVVAFRSYREPALFAVRRLFIKAVERAHHPVVRPFG